jgi:hypothetical protein
MAHVVNTMMYLRCRRTAKILAMVKSELEWVGLTMISLARIFLCQMRKMRDAEQFRRDTCPIFARTRKCKVVENFALSTQCIVDALRCTALISRFLQCCLFSSMQYHKFYK